jgi:sugar (pentulose or hexulose) kinase
VDWARRALFGDDGSFDAFDDAAIRGLAAPSRPLFLPSLAGERSPVPDAQASGAFLGLRPEHGREHLAASVLEGTAAALGEVLALLRTSGVPVEEIRLTSGGTRSAAWRGLVVAAGGAPARSTHGREGPARGAALLAAVRGGTDRDLAARAALWSRAGEAETPSPAETVRLRALAGRLAAIRAAFPRAR